MARKGKRGSGGLLGAAAIGVLALMASVPMEVWVVLGIGAVAYFAYRHYNPQAKREAAPQVAPRPPTARPAATGARAQRFVDDNEPVTAYRPDPADRPREYRVPAAPQGFGSATWVRPGQPINVAGFSIPGGMIYVGTRLATPYGDDDPCLIDPSLSASKSGDYAERQTGYWPSYSTIPSSARGAYLKWLAGGRQDPSADIG